jgi:hypothetical protein
MRRNDGLGGDGFDVVAEVIGIKGGVAHNPFGRQAGNQRVGLGDVVALTGRNEGTNRQAYRDTDFHRKLERLCVQSNIVFGEYAPAVFMDIVHSILRCQLPWPGPSIMSLFERSLLASKPDLLGLKDPDYYAITHAVFFVTDFGRSPENLPQDVKAYFLREANKIMFSFASRNHWDLLGEMLLCHAYLKTIDTPEFATYLQLLLAVQNADGSFTSDVEAKKPGDGSDKQWADHVEKYHTTLIFLLLSAALTTSTHAPAALRLA